MIASLAGGSAPLGLGWLASGGPASGGLASGWPGAMALAVACCGGWPEGSVLVRAADPPGVAAALAAIGHEATLGSDGVGDPMISVVAGEIAYDIHFYGCDMGAACEALLFVSGFEVPDAVPFARVNDWNRERLLGRAYLDEDGYPFLDHYLATMGGLAPAAFADTAEWWAETLLEFADHVGW